jgi:hypothetical protein
MAELDHFGFRIMPEDSGNTVSAAAAVNRANFRRHNSSQQ